MFQIKIFNKVLLNSFFLYFYQTMKIAPKNTYLSVLAAFVSGGLYAQDPPPPPTPVGPGFPINENVVVLVVAGVVLAAVYFYRSKKALIK
ncbi:hypothetical protein SAMN05444363_0200 [Flavobacterium terrae]|uniref:PEP-CTERM protein-sorting domain-containing protein n=2 Tax=Flavobacterium terrae TaxID=415425 RepID=A0A1M6AGF8_9FLAO|nr:hypothetical protein SAMN05444363_0200 [Flavobacterium terrae]